MEWTGARYADSPIVEVQAWIDSSLESVWGLVSDIELMPTMSAELRSVQWCDGVTGPAPDAAFVGHNKHEALGEWSTTSYVAECEPSRVFSWAVGDRDRPSATWRFLLEPQDGGTLLRQSVQMGPARSGLSFAIDKMPEREQKIVFVRLREFERDMTNNLAQIKALAEGDR